VHFSEVNISFRSITKALSPVDVVINNFCSLDVLRIGIAFCDFGFDEFMCLNGPWPYW